MKYMTPDLLARSQDEKTYEEASELWDGALAGYKKRLRSIVKELPRDVRILAFRTNLHDAQIEFVGFADDHTSALIVVKPDEPGNRLIILEYDLLKRPEEVSHASLMDFGSPWGTWLYDEFDTGEDSGVRFVTHSILFSGGQELKLTFRRMDLKTIGRHHGLQRAGATGEPRNRELQHA